MKHALDLDPPASPLLRSRRLTLHHRGLRGHPAQCVAAWAMRPTPRITAAGRPSPRRASEACLMTMLVVHASVFRFDKCHQQHSKGQEQLGSYMYHKQPLATRIGRGVHGMAAPADRLCADVNDPHGALSLSVHMQSVESGSPCGSTMRVSTQQSRAVVTSLSLSSCIVEIPAAVAPRLNAY